MSKSRNTVRTAVRFALLPCLTAAGLLPVTAMAQATLEEVVVTARKLEESLQEVPVAITAVTAATIEDLGIKDLADISKITPGLIFDNEFSRAGNRPVIRGQGNILGQSGVSYFIHLGLHRRLRPERRRARRGDQGPAERALRP